MPGPAADGNGVVAPKTEIEPTPQKLTPNRTQRKLDQQSLIQPGKPTSKNPPRRKRKRRVQITQFTAVATDPSNTEDQTITERLGESRTPLSGMMASMILHSLLLIALALSTYLWPAKEKNKGISLNVVMVDAPIIEQPKDNTETIQIDLPEEDETAPTELDEQNILDDIDELTPLLSDNDDLSKDDEVNPIPVEPAPITESGLLPTGGGLAGRDSEARAKRAGSSGGSNASEDAVELGLKWIAAHQRLDGSWRLNLKDTLCKGQCQHSGTRESSTAATGLALLAFLGAGYTQDTGPYQDEVQRGLDYLQSKIRISKFGGSLAEPTMYSHAIATMALGEAYAMTEDGELHSSLQAAMDYIIAAQHHGGGWRYNVQQPGDMTVTGWQIMALKSCELAGLDVPDEVWTAADKFLDSKQSNYGSTYGYIKPGEKNSPTAVGLLARMYSGWSRDTVALQQGAERVAEWGPSQSDIYFDYYGTLVLHHLQGDYWKDWNVQMRDYLVSTQDRRGHQNGSWHFEDQHGSVGGRLYTTAMAVMILEVYYRYLPLYEEKAVQGD